MGTRHVITVVKDGEFKLAQYGQWDGYPSGQGPGILKFLRNGDVEGFRKNVDLLHFADEAETKALYESIGITSEWMNMEQAERLKETFPTLSRDTGSKILSMIADGSAVGSDGRIPTVDMISFVGGWDCKWVYCIDLDTDVMEVYRAGFDENYGPTRFTEAVEAAFEGDEDRPCHTQLVGRYALGSLPTPRAFVDDLSPGSGYDEDDKPAPDGDEDGATPLRSL